MSAAVHALRTCRACGKAIPRDPKWSTAYYSTRKFCDKSCQERGRASITDDYVITARGCWEWQGPMDRNGYGKAYDVDLPAGHRIDWAHRVSYRKHVGPIPAGYELDHVCENTRCINPAHLDPVTKAEHVVRTVSRAGGYLRQREAARLRQSGLTYREIADAVGLMGRTSAFSMVKGAIDNGLIDEDALPEVRRLTPDDRADVRMLYALGIPQGEIAAWYRVDTSQISRVARGVSSHTSPKERRAMRSDAA